MKQVRRELEQVEREAKRRCLLECLYDTGSALRAKSVRSMMRVLGCAAEWDEFILEYLAGEGLVAVFPAGEKRELSFVEQANYIDECKRIEWDSVEANKMMMRIRQKGRRFLEGNEPDVKGVAKA